MRFTLIHIQWQVMLVTKSRNNSLWFTIRVRCWVHFHSWFSSPKPLRHSAVSVDSIKHTEKNKYGGTNRRELAQMNVLGDCRKTLFLLSAEMWAPEAQTSPYLLPLLPDRVRMTLQHGVLLSLGASHWETNLWKINECFEKQLWMVSLLLSMYFLQNQSQQYCDVSALVLESKGDSIVSPRWPATLGLHNRACPCTVISTCQCQLLGPLADWSENKISLAWAHLITVTYFSNGKTDFQLAFQSPLLSHRNNYHLAKDREVLCRKRTLHLSISLMDM